jgi:FkbM family methyltransferase
MVHEALTSKISKTAAFYKSFLFPIKNSSASLLAFDIGANKGNKTKALLQSGFNVIALEPEKKSISTLKYRFEKNPKVTIIEKGVSSTEGVTEIYITEARSGLNTMNTKWKETLHNKEESRWGTQVDFKEFYQVPLTTAENLFAEFGEPYFIKIDVEGFELEVIKGMKSLPSFISLEANLPEFAEETINCITLLNNLSGGVNFNYSFNEKLILENWLTATEMISYISNTKERYIEIICRK